MTITYASSRADIVFAYFRTWRQSTRMKIMQIAMVAFVFLVNMAGGGSVSRGVVWAVAALAFLFLYPQLSFKSGVRSLTISATGIATTIGSRSGQVPWSVIRNIEDIGDRILVVGNDLNSFVIPSRAFSSESERTDFLEKARAWLVGATPQAG